MMRSPKYIAERLSLSERTLLKKIRDGSETKDYDAKEIRDLEWLKFKNLIDIDETERKVIKLDRNGKEYAKKGLPEERFIRMLGKGKSLSQIKNSLSHDEFNFCIGFLKKESYISIDKGKPVIKKKPDFKIKSRVLKCDGKSFDELNQAERRAAEELVKRKDIIEVVDKPRKKIKFTSLGKKIRLLTGNKTDLIEKITVKVIKNDEWKNKEIRKYDVEAPAPNVTPGRIHFLRNSLEYARRIWLEMGFKEMRGPYVVSSFWNFDALYTPQDHPARELQDTFFVKNQVKDNIPKDIMERVKETHENGWTTGSSGWKMEWSREEAMKPVLRSHTTATSARTLASLKLEDLPAKYFAIGPNFRNETWDWNHTSDFYQVDGIVVDEDVNFRHLLGYLRAFFTKMGFPQVKFRPHYFPYTEMSMEIDAYHPVKKTWVEMGGAGMFRPEVTKPLLGKDIPVLAWGPGISRLIMDAYALKSIRELKSNDLDMLRNIKEWVR